MMSRNLEDWLSDKTEFWLVKPEISLAGVSGIEALLSGNYITFRPARGKPEHRFHALDDAPPLAEGKPGLHISLDAPDGGSLIPGSPVYSRHIHVGEVERVMLKKDGNAVQIDLYIEPEYASLVRTNTHFWNVSGVHVHGPLSHLKVETDSLLAILKGGVAFSTPEWESLTASQVAGQRSRFKLYPDFETARSGIPITIEFPLSAHIVQAGARIMFHGIEAGIVKNYEIKDDVSGFTVEALMNPLAETALVEGARFWLVEARITARGIEGLDSLLSGRYIAMDVTDKALKDGHTERKFHGHINQPPAGKDAPGLHLTLTSDSSDGLSEGSAIWLKGMNIGSVQELSFHGQGVEANILIEPAFQHLIRSGVRFWKASGLSVSAGMSGVTVETRPLAALIRGGVFCEVPSQNTVKVDDGSNYPLYANRHDAFRQGRRVTLFSPSLSSVKKGAPVFYRGVVVGEVVSIALADPADRVEVTLLIHSPYELLVTEGSRFWNVSGLNIEVGALKGVEIHTQSLEALIRGGIAFATPENAPPAPSETSFLLHENAEDEWLNWHPAISLARTAKDGRLGVDR